MRPQDIVVLLAIALEGKKWRVIDIAKKIGLSQSETSESISRSSIAGLIDKDNKILLKNALVDFIMYGLKYVFPVAPAGIKRGIPTAHSASPLNKIILSNNDVFVWPYSKGEKRGQSIEPLYPNIPYVALENKKLYELLSLIDAVRIGKVREHNLAINEIKKRLFKDE